MPELIIVMIGANINGVETMENIYTVGIVNNNTKLAEYYSAASVFLILPGKKPSERQRQRRWLVEPRL